MNDHFEILILNLDEEYIRNESFIGLIITDMSSINNCRLPKDYAERIIEL